MSCRRVLSVLSLAWGWPVWTACYASHGDSGEDVADGGAESVADADSGSDADVGFDVTCPSAMACGPLECPSDMVLVPCGPFVMGPDETGNIDRVQVVCMSAYCIDRTEVSWAAWDACVAAGGCPPIACAGRSHEPVTCATRTAAESYCRWAGKRLATDAQWEKAARGGCEVVAPATCGPEDMRPYPWGDAAPTCDLANFRSEEGESCLPFGAVDAVDARPAGASPYGALNMAGNAPELVGDDWLPSYVMSLPPGALDPPGPPGYGWACVIHRGGGSAGRAGDLWALMVSNRWASSSCYLSPSATNEDLRPGGFRCTYPP